MVINKNSENIVLIEINWIVVKSQPIKMIPIIRICWGPNSSNLIFSESTRKIVLKTY